MPKHSTSGLLDVNDIVKESNNYRIGKWKLFFNAKNNNPEIDFSNSIPNTLKISVAGSSGWIRLLRPLEDNGIDGVCSVSLGVRTLTQKPDATYKAYIFRQKEKGRFDKHSEMTFKDGQYKTRLLLGKNEYTYWIGFETFDENIELYVGHIHVEVLPISKELIKLSEEGKKITLPLVASACKAENYQKIKKFNEIYITEIKTNELTFLLDYACSLRRIEMPETYLRMIKYLSSRYSEFVSTERAILETQIRFAYILTHDHELLEILYLKCPEVLFKLKLNSDIFEKIMGLQLGENDIANLHQNYSPLYVAQNDPEKLANLVRSYIENDGDYLDKHPQTYAALANVFASRICSEFQYKSFLNKFLKKHFLPKIDSLKFDSENFLTTVKFSEMAFVREGPLVSVIMSAHNSEKTIEYAVKSILAQTYKNLELLVCDDSSEDSTIEILREIAINDKRLKFYKSNGRQGTYNIRNDMISQCSGDYITFQDSDDYAIPCRIQEQIQNILEKNILISFSNWVRVKEDGKFVIFHDGYINRFCVVSAMAHRTVFERLPKFRSSYVGADTEFYENVKNMLGIEEIHIDERPMILGLWSESSLTKQVDLTAEHNGYVASKRRKYAEIASRQRIQGVQIVTNPMIDELLKSLEIYREPSGFEDVK